MDYNRRMPSGGQSTLYIYLLLNIPLSLKFFTFLFFITSYCTTLFFVILFHHLCITLSLQILLWIYFYQSDLLSYEYMGYYDHLSTALPYCIRVSQTLNLLPPHFSTHCLLTNTSWTRSLPVLMCFLHELQLSSHFCLSSLAGTFVEDFSICNSWSSEWCCVWVLIQWMVLSDCWFSPVFAWLAVMPLEPTVVRYSVLHALAPWTNIQKRWLLLQWHSEVVVAALDYTECSCSSDPRQVVFTTTTTK